MKLAAFALVLSGALIFFLVNVRRLVRYLQTGKPEDRFDRPLERLRKVLTIALGQKKLLREPLAGWMHFFIFWGFVILLTAILETFLQGFGNDLSFKFLGILYSPLVFMQDIMGALVVISVIVASYRRNIAHVKRLRMAGHSQFDANVILCLILLIMITMFLQNAAHISIEAASAGASDTLNARSRIFSSAISGIFFVYPLATRETIFQLFWWFHVLLVLGFLNYLPYSKHLHIGSSFFNVYFSSLAPRGELKMLNLEAENITRFGAGDIEDLSWKQLLDGYTCTECGRCDSVCPANITGKPLSPRKIITDIRRRTMEKAPAIVAGENVDDSHIVDKFISEEELWACTTCRACMEECPVMIEHVDSIVDMRRFLVLNESRFPTELGAAYRNLENNFSVWAFNWRDRAKWTEGSDIPIAAEVNDDFDILYWVGCAGSFDARYQKVARAFSEIMKRAGIKFAILGNEEKCTGDPARRSGNEYLAQTLIKENVQTLSKHKVKKIVASCPHCFNTLKNEYPDFGGNYEVLHHTELINELIKSGKFKLGADQKAKITYHDSCYIGRYNGVYDAPREAMSHMGGVELVEMKRTKDKGLCCGAGGGRMWMEETAGKRINIERTEEALATGAGVIASACPFCMTMLTDGVKAKEASAVQVKDIAELLLEAAGGEQLKSSATS